MPDSLIRSAAVGSHGRSLSRLLAVAACLLTLGTGLAAQITREAPAGPPIPSAALDLRPLFSQQRPILDVLPEERRRHVLDATGLTLYERTPTGWQAARSWPVTPPAPWPRDLRGMLAFDADAVELFLPNLRCSLSSPERVFGCQTASGAWDQTLIALSLPTAGASYLAGTTDGFLTLLDADRKPVARMMAGDDAVALAGGCRDDPYVLARIDAEGGDALALFQVRDRKMQEVAPRRLLHGRVTALWSDNTDARSGRVVVRAADAERYDAYKITVACVR